MMKNGTVFAIWKEKSGNGRPAEAASESHRQVNSDFEDAKNGYEQPALPAFIGCFRMK